jgi:hypothetical protein
LSLPSPELQPTASNHLPRYEVSVDQVKEGEWNALVDSFADANFYQTWAYGAISWGENQLSHCVVRVAGHTVAIAQLRIVKLPVVRAGIAYLRWGPACQPKGHAWEPEIHRQALQAIEEEYAGRRGLMLRVIPNVFAQDAASTHVLAHLKAHSFQLENDTTPYRTLRVDLRQEPDIIRKRLDGKWRNQLNAAERNGLTILEGSEDTLYRQFLDLYNEMMARKQFETTVDAAEFQQIQQRLPEQQKMIVMISVKDGVPQTALVSTSVGSTGIYLLGATSNEGMKSKGSYLLQWRMMNRLRERGCHWYDLGGINPETNPGVYHFKSGMGGEEVTGLGRFERQGDALSSAAVNVGAHMQSWMSKMKGALRPKNVQPGAGSTENRSQT